jgi:endonuclease/exonuclease/phosphatase (EEP) superfamily protein YafD
MRILKVLLGGLVVLFFVFTFIPLLPWNFWWIRVFVFPRIQIVVILFVLLVLWLIFFFRFKPLSLLFTLLLAASLFYQGFRIFPYTFLSEKQTSPASKPSEELKLYAMTANVYMKNRQSEALLELVRKRKPDLLLLLETDHRWKEKMDVLKKRYPYTLSKPLDNTYGMLLYSRLPLHRSEIRYLVEDSIPSIHTYVELR